jgi:hypothetical protein
MPKKDNIEPLVGDICSDNVKGNFLIVKIDENMITGKPVGDGHGFRDFLGDPADTCCYWVSEFNKRCRIVHRKNAKKG